MELTIPRQVCTCGGISFERLATTTCPKDRWRIPEALSERPADSINPMILLRCFAHRTTPPIRLPLICAVRPPIQYWKPEALGAGDSMPRYTVYQKVK